MNTILRLGMVIFLVSGMNGCSRGYDPTQVTSTKNAAGETTHVLIAPIKGKPFADGAQYVMDNLIKSQTGGDIQSIKVDPASVKVVFSQMEDATQYFIIVGNAQVTLVDGKGQFDVRFRDTFAGLMGPGRELPNCSDCGGMGTTAYSQGLSNWMNQYTHAESDFPTDKRYAEKLLSPQLSLGQLVDEITPQGAIKMQALGDWRKANAFAWKQWDVLQPSE
jgi:hypothetical protein